MTDESRQETLHGHAARQARADRAAERPRLVLVDTETGERHDRGCPDCERRETEYKELELKYRGALSQIGNLKSDRDRDAREHEFWPDAVELFEEWKIATGPNRPSGKNKSRWSAPRFWAIFPFLRDDGFVLCRYAIWGIAAHPNRRQITADYDEVYDGWELLFRSRDTFERYANRGVAIFGDAFEIEERD